MNTLYPIGDFSIYNRRVKLRPYLDDDNVQELITESLNGNGNEIEVAQLQPLPTHSSAWTVRW